MADNTKRNSETYKSDSSEMEKRVNQIYLLILQGFQRKQIIQFCSENYKIGERQTDEYLFKAREIIKSNIETDTSSKKNELLNQYYDLYRKNYEEEDYRECRNILKDIGAIFGVEAMTKIDLTTNGNSITPPQIVFQAPKEEDE